MNADEKECPFCFEVIKARAIKCKHCGSDLRLTSDPLPTPPQASPVPPPSEPPPIRPVQETLSPVSIENEEIIALLMSLVEKNLVVYEKDAQGQDRYRLLETVRQYASDRLFEQEDAVALLSRHAEHFQVLAAEAQKHLNGPEQGEWFCRLETEHGNFRATLIFLRQEPESGEAGLRLLTALQRFWLTYGHITEGRQWYLSQLAHPGAQQRTTFRAAALNGVGALTRIQGDYTQARAYHEESLSIFQEMGSQLGIASALGNLGITAHEQSDHASTQAYYEQSLQLFREIDHQHGISASLSNIGSLAREQGDYAKAAACFEENLTIRQAMGDKEGIAGAHCNLGDIAYDQGNHATAQKYQEESIALFREIGSRGGLGNALNSLGDTLASQGEYALARAHYEESLAIRREVGEKHNTAYTLTNLAQAVTALGEYAAARAYLTESLTIFQQSGGRKGIVNALEAFAYLATTQATATSPPLTECFQRAMSLWSVTEDLRAEIGLSLSPENREKRTREIARAREALGEESFALAWQAGKEMPLDQAIAYALSEEG